MADHGLLQAHTTLTAAGGATTVYVTPVAGGTETTEATVKLYIVNDTANVADINVSVSTTTDTHGAPIVPTFQLGAKESVTLAGIAMNEAFDNIVAESSIDGVTAAPFGEEEEV